MSQPGFPKLVTIIDMLFSSFRFSVIMLISVVGLLSSCTKDELVTNPPTTTPPTSNILPEMIIQGTPDNAKIQRGEQFQHELFLKMEDPSQTIQEAVIFLNVLYVYPDGFYEPAFDQFETPNVTNNIFSKVISADQLREGVNTNLGYTVRNDAKLGQYDINIQVFQGDITNPLRAKASDRIGIQNIFFDVIE